MDGLRVRDSRNLVLLRGYDTCLGARLLKIQSMLVVERLGRPVTRVKARYEDSCLHAAVSRSAELTRSRIEASILHRGECLRGQTRLWEEKPLRDIIDWVVPREVRLQHERLELGRRRQLTLEALRRGIFL